MTSSVNYSTQQYFGFDPRTIPQCSVWLDAADSSTITYSTAPTISQLRNKAVDGTAAFAAGTPSLSASAINGRPAFLLGSGNYLAGGIIPNINQTTMSCFAVAVTTATLPKSGPDQRLISLMSPSDLDYTTPLTAIGLFNQSGTSSIATYRNFTFISTSSISQNTPFLAGSVYNGSTGRLWKDGTAGSGPTATTGNFGITKYSIGIHVNNPGALEYWIGSVGEVLIYSTSLSDVQRQQVEGYLAWKWGLQANLPTGHPFRSNPTAMRIFQPLDITGLYLWMDAADSSTITTSGTNVTQWRDKSSNAFVFNGAVGTYPTYTTTLNRLPVISSATGQKLRTTGWNQNFTSGRATLFFLIRPTQNITVEYQGYPIFRRVTGTGTIQLDITYSGQNNYWYYLQVWTNNSFMFQGSLSNTSLFNPTNLPLLMTAVVNGTTANIGRYNGATVSPIMFNAANTFPSLTGVTLDLIGAADARGFDTCEIIVYNGVLTLQQYQTIEGYLASKWGLSGSLPTTAPFYLSRSLPSTPLFVPPFSSNISLWLDAADSSTITLSGSSVTTWSDKSGSGYNFTNNSTVTPFSLNNFPTYTSNGLNGLPVVTFSSVQTLGSADVFAGNQTQSFSIFCVGTVGSINRGRDGYGNGWSISILPTQTSDSYVLTTNGTAQYNIIRSTASLPIYATTVVQTTSTTAVVRINGTETGRTTFANYTLRSSTIGHYIGFGGYTAEMLIYNRSLSNSEFQQIEGYLAWKWGLQNSLPTTHPYRKFRP